MATENFERGSGNVFADLGMEDPEACLAKSEIVMQIQRSLERIGASGPEGKEAREALAEKLPMHPDDLEEMLNGALFHEWPLEDLASVEQKVRRHVLLTLGEQEYRRAYYASLSGFSVQTAHDAAILSVQTMDKRAEDLERLIDRMVDIESGKDA